MQLCLEVKQKARILIPLFWQYTEVLKGHVDTDTLIVGMVSRKRLSRDRHMHRRGDGYTAPSFSAGDIGVWLLEAMAAETPIYVLPSHYGVTFPFRRPMYELAAIRKIKLPVVRAPPDT